MPASYDKKWFFARTDKICGSWAGGPPEHDRQPGDQPGTLVHKGDSPAPQFDYPLPQYLGPDGELWSRNRFYYLRYRADTGALVIYKADGTPFDNNFQVPAHTPGCAAMQSDGNFVVYSGEPGTPMAHCGDGNYFVWNTATQCDVGFCPDPRSTGAYAVMQDDGNFVIWSLEGVPLYQRF